MENKSAFTFTEPELLTVLEDLVKLEPIFHTSEFGTSVEDFEGRTAPEYWEVGASGLRYSRDFIISELRARPPAFALPWVGRPPTMPLASLAQRPICLSMSCFKAGV